MTSRSLNRTKLSKVKLKFFLLIRTKTFTLKTQCQLHFVALRTVDQTETILIKLSFKTRDPLATPLIRETIPINKVNIFAQWYDYTSTFIKREKHYSFLKIECPSIFENVVSCHTGMLCTNFGEIDSLVLKKKIFNFRQLNVRELFGNYCFLFPWLIWNKI